jgi:hypothetical protein
MMPPRPIRACLAIALIFAVTTAVPAFELRTKKEKLLESGELTISILQYHNLNFTFLGPRNWVTTPDAKNERIVLQSRDFAMRIVMQIHKADSTARLPSDPAELRKKVLEQIPDATITEESKCYASNLAGQAFNLQQQVDGQVTTCCRVAYVPFAGGWAEFTASASAPSWPTALAEFGAFLTSFNVESR